MKSARNPSLNRRHFLSQVLATGALLPLPLSLRGQTKPPAHTREVEAFINGIYAERHQRFTFRDDYPGGFAKWQQDARPELRRLVGLETIARQIGTAHGCELAAGCA